MYVYIYIYLEILYIDSQIITNSSSQCKPCIYYIMVHDVFLVFTLYICLHESADVWMNLAATLRQAKPNLQETTP